MIKNTLVGILKSTGEQVYQYDIGSLRAFKTAAGKVVAVKEISFITGPVKPQTDKDIVVEAKRASDIDIEQAEITEAIMIEINEEWR